jgi:hypothetical protein
MPTYRAGVVSEVLETRPGLQRVLVDLGANGEPAYVLTQLVGPVATGDHVVVNTSAVELGLGTGGWHVVHWNLSRDEWTEPARAGEGETAVETVMKLRYTSLQVDVGAETVDLDDDASDVILGVPVVVGTLHSQVAAVAAAFKHCCPDRRLVYVMTDGGALPIAISDLVWNLRARGLFDATVTCGHAFGGDHEAVSVASGLVAARAVARADAIVVAMGPGGVGTASRFGFSGLEAAAALDSTAALGGIPILAVRASFADPRPRHRGVSHHTKAVLEATRSPVQVPVPQQEGEGRDRLRRDLAAVARTRGHEVADVAVPDVVGLFVAHDLDVASMGRPAAEDPVFHAAAGAAGVLAATAVQ